MNTNKLKLMKKTGLLVLVLLLAITAAFSQENTTAKCSNGVDDDGDGFIDCYDSDCTNLAVCDGTYLGNDKACQSKPTTFPTFSMQKKKGYTPLANTTNHLNRPSIGDIIVDKSPLPTIPEIVVLQQAVFSSKGYATDGYLNNSEW